ncbi:hypothetical protein [Brevibacillus centrosporus]|uniref:hypothetical protein n=1 Tax=Brevibacillus centrosporus TaxID=54910 RepID=UPI002E221AC2|nr:hypothetical protein [Brevibacillus centrosporus]
MNEARNPSIRFVVLSEDANVLRTIDGQKTFIFNPLILIKKPLPYKQPLTISVGFDDVDVSRSNVIRIELNDPSGIQLFSTVQVLNEDIEEDSFIQGAFGVDVEDLVFRKAGKYTVTIFINDVHLGNQFLNVYDTSEV